MALPVNLFIEGEHLPVVSDIADPVEGRAKLTVRYVDPRTLEKQPLLTGARFRTGQYVFMDERAGTICHALIVKRAEKRNPYRDLPEQDRQFSAPTTKPWRALTRHRGMYACTSPSTALTRSWAC